MNITDIILSIMLAVGAFSGYKKGLILELVAIVAFVLAIIGGLQLLHVGMSYLSRVYDGFGNLLPFVAFLVLFVLIMILVNLLGRIVKKIIDWTPLGFIDNFAGAIIGIAKWSLGISVLVWVMSGLHIEIPAKISQNSMILPYITKFGHWTVTAISVIFPSLQHFLDTVRDFFENLAS